MFTRRTLLCGVAALALLAVAVTAGKKPPPPPPPSNPDPAILYEGPLDQNNERPIWVMNADGTNQTRVISLYEDGVSLMQGSMSWSGDNTRFVFTGWNPNEAGYTMGLYVSDIAGLYPDRIHTTNTYDGVKARPSWSPTPLQGQSSGEEWIVFADQPGGAGHSWDLFAIALRPDGTTRGPFNLTYRLAGSWSRFEPCVSFDGTLVAYCSWDTWQVYVGTVGTDEAGNPLITAETCLTAGLGMPTWDYPAIDPSGDFVVAQGVTAPGGGSALWIIPTNVADVPSGAYVLLAAQSRERIDHPAWVDGHTVVYEDHHQKPTFDDVRAIDTGTRNVTRLADGRRPAPRR